VAEVSEEAERKKGWNRRKNKIQILTSNNTSKSPLGDLGAEKAKGQKDSKGKRGGIVAYE
jgi:hypothetical protein